MQEVFLHFIWQYQYFNKAGLTTSDGVAVNVIHPGIYNTDAGPDFKEAKILMAEIEWRGHVEIHVKSAEWARHRHHKDDAYNNVILHVVWKHDQEIKRKDNTILPTVELQGLVQEQLFFSYKQLINSPFRIPCERQLNKVTDITWMATLDKMLMERLAAKAEFVEMLLKKNNQDWEETAYQLLAKNFGFKINSEPFLIFAESLPYKFLKKHSDNMLLTEALVFGQAGFLNEDPVDDYQAALLQEYTFMKHKYGLQERLASHQWKFLRLRPANFPTVRLAQFSAVVYTVPALFQRLLDINSFKQLKKLLKVKQSEYWRNHYRFGKGSGQVVASMGDASIESIAINVVAPLLAAYSSYIDDMRYTEKGVALLQEIKAEKNRIINYWATLDTKVTTAFDSQALIQLYNEYCSKGRCLSCSVGVSLIREK